MNTTTVHNNFFSDLFSDERNVRDFLSAKLPMPVRKRLDLSKISLDRENYTGGDSREHRMDLLVHTETTENDPADIYILFEHKSSPDRSVLVQILRYMTTLWEQDSRQGIPLRPVIPLVFYHGKQRWSIPDAFHDMFSCDDVFMPFIPSFKYHLFDTADHDLSPDKNPQLRNNVWLLSSLMAMKSAQRNDIEGLRQMIRLWREHDFISRKEEVRIILTYTLTTIELEKETFSTIIEEELHEGGDLMPTVAEQWMNEGREKGRQEGVQEGIINTCRNALREGSPPEYVAKITGLPLEKILEIKKSL